MIFGAFVVLALCAQERPDAVAPALSAVLARGVHQTELPGSTPAAGEPEPSDGTRRERRLRADGTTPRHVVPIGPTGGDLARALVWIAVATVGVLFAIQAVQVLAARPARDAPGPRAAPRESAPAPAPRGPGSERLAREERYGEAVHALLLETLQELGARRGRPVAPEDTAREVSRALGLRGESARALGELLATAERCVFGGRAADRETWTRCAERAARLAAGGPAA